MTDILERLQSDGEGERQQFREARATLGSLLNEAAAEIERLRAALERIAFGKYHWEADAQEEARAALEGKHD